MMTLCTTALPYILRVTRTRGVGLPDLPSAARAFAEAEMTARGSAFYCGGKGDILDARTGEIVAHVSANGRVWAGARWTPGQTPIAERYEAPCADCDGWVTRDEDGPVKCLTCAK